MSRRRLAFGFCAVLAAALAIHEAAGQGGFSEGLAAYRRGDYASAREAWLPLAESGSTEAQYNLGLLYHQGLGVEIDLEQAAAWYEKAARSGLVRAQYDLARLYDERQGVRGDDLRAYAWYKIAGLERYRDARKRRRAVADRLTPHEIAQGDLFVREWKAGRIQPESAPPAPDR